MGDSFLCKDFGDFKRVTTPQVTCPDSAMSDEGQSSSPAPHKHEGEDEAGDNARNPCGDFCISGLYNSECNVKQRDEEVIKQSDEDQLSQQLLTNCPSCSTHDGQIAPTERNFLTADDAGACIPAFTEPETCKDVQVISQEQNKNISDHFHAEMDYSSSVLIGRPETNMRNCQTALYDLPVHSPETCDGFHVQVDENLLREHNSDLYSDADNKDETLDCADSDNYPSSTDVRTLDQLDDDVLYHIASFLEARVLRFALSRVCWRFRIMFLNETYWRMRINNKWPKQYPAVPGPPDFNWVDALVEREDNHRVWSDVANQKQHFMYSYNLFGGVDAVHLMKEGQLAVCGDRSRTLNIIDLSKHQGPEVEEKQMQEMLCHCDRVVHQGWIWSIASVGDQIVTGSWDTYVRMFDVGAGCQLTANFKCQSAVLCLYAEDQEIVASCSDRKVYFFDHRTSKIRAETFHTQPVLCVAGNENFIISGSEDKSISVYDRRAGKILSTVKVKNYPMCMSYSDNQLWFGDRTGALHLHDGSSGLFQHIGSYDVGHTEKMTGVVSTRGATYTCSGDKTIKVLHPTRDPDIITTLAAHRKEIARIDYRGGVLVSAGGDDCIGVWLPKHWGRESYLL